MPGKCRIPEQMSYSNDGVAEPQPQCLMHKQVVFLAKHLGGKRVSRKGKSRQVVRVSEAPHTLASTSAQVEYNSLWHLSNVKVWRVEPKSVQDTAKLHVHMQVSQLKWCCLIIKCKFTSIHHLSCQPCLVLHIQSPKPQHSYIHLYNTSKCSQRLSRRSKTPQ